MKNIASVLEVDESLNMFFNTFYKSPYRERSTDVSQNQYGGAGGSMASLNMDMKDGGTRGRSETGIDDYDIGNEGDDEDDKDSYYQI